MNRDDVRWRVGAVANEVLREHAISSLPVNPMALAAKVGIHVKAKSATAAGVSGMLLRLGNDFGIAYATHIDSPGFQNFSVAHELGHYFLPGHIDAVLGHGDVHESRAGSYSDDRYEVEADHFAAALLMPEDLFRTAIGSAGSGLTAIEGLAQLCVTSLTATAIRFTQFSGDIVAVVVSAGNRVIYCFMSEALEEIAGNNRIQKGEQLPPGTPTAEFNKDANRVKQGQRHAGTSDLQDWIGGRHSVELTEQVVGLGGYGRTLTVLTSSSPTDLEDLEEDAQIAESWTPRFRR